MLRGPLKTALWGCDGMGWEWEFEYIRDFWTIWESMRFQAQGEEEERDGDRYGVQWGGPGLCSLEKFKVELFRRVGTFLDTGHGMEWTTNLCRDGRSLRSYSSGPDFLI